MPKLLDWNARDDWTAAGSTTLRQRAATRARDLIASHEPEPLPPELVDALEDVIRRRAASLPEPA
jgi:trimethylamine:corrinoid methyltransferase-like protein